MKTNKFIENSTKETLDRLKESFANKDVEYKEVNQINLLKRISDIKLNIDIVEIRIIELLQQDDVDIEVLINTTKKYNNLKDTLNLLNSYKSIFGIN